MRLDVLTLKQCEQVRLWRNLCPETLRTPYPLTKEQQEEFYQMRVCNSDSPHRYWAIVEPDDGDFIGMGGLTYISWPNRIAEISLILDPIQRGKGLGEQAVDLLLEQGFDRMGLKSIYGECYLTHDGWNFWAKIIDKYQAYATKLPNRKFHQGRFFDSMYFSIDAEDWRKVHVKPA